MVSPGKLKVYGIVAGIFVLGTAAGGAAGYAAASKRVADVLDEERPELRDARRFEAIAAELDLTREQRDKVRQIMEKHRDENKRLTRDMFERCGDDLHELRNRVDAEIRGVLTPAQADRFKKLMEKRGRRYPLGGPGPRFRKGDHGKD